MKKQPMTHLDTEKSDVILTSWPFLEVVYAMRYTVRQCVIIIPLLSRVTQHTDARY